MIVPSESHTSLKGVPTTEEVISPLKNRDLLLEIFHYLTPRELLTCAVTCRFWRNISEDCTLWKRHLLSLRTLSELPSKICTKRHYFIENDNRKLFCALKLLQESKLMVSDTFVDQWTRIYPNASVVVLDDGYDLLQSNTLLTDLSLTTIAQRCSHLVELHLISLVPPDGFPSITIEGLTTIAAAHPQLNKLTLDCCPAVLSADLCRLVNSLTSLSTLQISSPEVTDTVVAAIAKQTQLTSLTLASAVISDAALGAIGSHLTQLRHFELRVFEPTTFSAEKVNWLFSCGSMWHSLVFHPVDTMTDQQVITLAQTATSLQTLNLTNCQNLTTKALDQLSLCNQLSNMCLQGANANSLTR